MYCIFCLPCFVVNKCNARIHRNEKALELEWLDFAMFDFEEIQE